MLKIFKNLTYKEWLLALLAVGFIVLQVWLDLTLPDYMSGITMLVQTPGSKMKDVWWAGGKMLLCALGSLLAAVAVSVVAARIASNFSSILRGKLFSAVQNFSMAEMGKFSTASLITRSTNDVTHVQMLIVMGLQSIIKAPITAVWAICKISAKNWQWTLATALAVIILLAIVITCTSIALPRFRKMQTLVDDVNRVTRENLTGLKVVRAYNAEAYQENKFARANENLTSNTLSSNRTMQFMQPGIQLVLSGLSLAVYWIGAFLINKAGAMEKLVLFSDMVVFSQYAVQVVMAFMMLVMIFIMLPRASVAAKRINEVLDTVPSLVDGEVVSPEDGKEGEIEFRNVSFKYPDAEDYELKDINFTAKKGETIAFIGATGSGKSTLINLIPRFYDASEGEVLVGGVNVKDYKQSALRDGIGYVSQKATMFSGTVRDNIAFGSGNSNDFSDENLARSAQVAHASEFIDRTNEGYDAFVAQGGTNFSGGQKQRLSIARAVCRKPEIFIFDDSFSALDYKTDRELRDALDRECSQSTRLIVAQRIGTIKDADRIIVLDDGRIAGQGTHDELMRTCDVYREIALSQLSKEELGL